MIEGDAILILLAQIWAVVYLLGMLVLIRSKLIGTAFENACYMLLYWPFIVAAIPAVLTLYTIIEWVPWQYEFKLRRSRG